MSEAPGYSIRLATQADFEGIPALERRAGHVFRSIEGYGFVADGPVTDIDEIERTARDGVVLVIQAANRGLVGFAMVLGLDGEAHLDEIDIDPAHQRKGLARALLAKAEAWARARGYAAMTLTTYRDVPWNAPFYGRLGFQAFDPGPERAGLTAIIAQEAANGFARMPRVAMRKLLA